MILTMDLLHKPPTPPPLPPILLPLELSLMGK